MAWSSERKQAPARTKEGEKERKKVSKERKKITQVKNMTEDGRRGPNLSSISPTLGRTRYIDLLGKYPEGKFSKGRGKE